MSEDVPRERVEVRGRIFWVLFAGIALFGFLGFAFTYPVATGRRFIEQREDQIFFACVVAAFVAWLALCWWLARRRLIVDETGITTRGLFGTRRAAWNEVDYYKYDSLSDQNVIVVAPQAAGLVGMALAAIAVFGRSRQVAKNPHMRFNRGRLVLVRRDGTKLVVRPVWRNVERALERIFDELHRQLRTGAPSHSPFTLSESQLKSKLGTLELTELDKVELGRRGISVEVRGDVHLPHGVRSGLRAAAAREAAMPEARLVERRRRDP